MKKLAASVLVLGMMGLGFSQTLRKHIEMSDKSISKAMTKKDVAKMEELMAPDVTSDFQHVEDGKSMSFHEMLDEMKLGFSRLDRVTAASSKLLSLKESGDTGTAVISHLMTGISKGPDKKVHKMKFSGVTKDTYVKEDGKWKLSKMEWTEQKMSMDGKSMSQSGMQH